MSDWSSGVWILVGCISKDTLESILPRMHIKTLVTDTKWQPSNYNWNTPNQNPYAWASVRHTILDKRYEIHTHLSWSFVCVCVCVCVCLWERERQWERVGAYMHGCVQNQCLRVASGATAPGPALEGDPQQLSSVCFLKHMEKTKFTRQVAKVDLV